MSRVATQPRNTLTQNGISSQQPTLPSSSSFTTNSRNSNVTVKSAAPPLATKETVHACPSCNSEYKDPRVLPCTHTFCLQCIRDKLVKNNRVTCPRCHSVFAPFDEQQALDLPKNMILSQEWKATKQLPPQKKNSGVTYGSNASIKPTLNNNITSLTPPLSNKLQQKKQHIPTLQPTTIHYQPALDITVHDRTSETPSRTSSIIGSGGIKSRGHSVSSTTSLSNVRDNGALISNLQKIFSEATAKSTNARPSVSNEKNGESLRTFKETPEKNRIDDHYEEIVWNSLVNGPPDAPPLPENWQSSSSRKPTSQNAEYATISSIIKPRGDDDDDDDGYENRHRTYSTEKKSTTNAVNNLQEIIASIQRRGQISFTSSPTQQRTSNIDLKNTEYRNNSHSPRDSYTEIEPVQGQQFFDSQISRDSIATASDGQIQANHNVSGQYNFNLNKQRESVSSQRDMPVKRASSRNDSTLDDDENYNTPRGTDRSPSRQDSLQQQQDHGYSITYGKNSEYRTPSNRASVSSSYAPSIHGNDQHQDRPLSAASSNRHSSTSKRDSMRSDLKFPPPPPPQLEDLDFGSNKRPSSASSSIASQRSRNKYRTNHLQTTDRFNPDIDVPPPIQLENLESGSTTPTEQPTPRQQLDSDRNDYTEIIDQRRISNVSDRQQQQQHHPRLTRSRTNSDGDGDGHYLAPIVSTSTDLNHSTSPTHSGHNNNHSNRASSTSLVASNVTSKVENLLHDQKRLEQEIEETLKRLTYDYEDIKTQIEKKEVAIHAEVKHISTRLDQDITEHYYRKQKIYSSLANETQSVGNELKRLKQTDQRSIQQLITGNKLWDNLEQLEQNIRQIRNAVENEKEPRTALKFQEGRRALTADTIGQITCNDDQQQRNRRQTSSYDDSDDRHNRIQQLFNPSVQSQLPGDTTTALTPYKYIKIDHLSSLEPEAIAIADHSNKILLGICNKLFILNEYGEILKTIPLAPSIRGIAISKKQSTNNIAYISHDETVSMIDIQTGNIIDCVKETDAHGQSGTFLPLGIDTDNINGHVYVCDYRNSCVIKFDDKLEFITQWRIFNHSDNYDEARPKLISVYGTKLYMIVEHSCKPYYNQGIAYTFSLHICDNQSGHIIKIIDEQLLLTQRLRWPCSVQAINDEKCYILDTMTSGKYFNGQWQKHWSRVLEIQSQGQQIIELFQLDSEAATMAMSKQTMIIAANAEILYVDLQFMSNINSRDKRSNSTSPAKPHTTSSSSTTTMPRASKTAGIENDSPRYTNMTATNDYNGRGGEHNHDYQNL
ncbi:unnamed protein product [Didymodactylos carnosus]|uniref:RING-type domain-containing protein n=1 Tax=Didymodactylos carnosus TaxID=1234261 RepID=A0A813R1J0_9BILA|nr:unnamed protein product [Didymodactylos carnosus]CAF3559695.1 unnamed protein product [Didymodactylos carnosus]